jgi:hypothetical protein
MISFECIAAAVALSFECIAGKLLVYYKAHELSFAVEMIDIVNVKATIFAIFQLHLDHSPSRLKHLFHCRHGNLMNVIFIPHFSSTVALV